MLTRWLKLQSILVKSGWSTKHLNYLYVNVYYETDALTKVFEWNYALNKPVDKEFKGAGLIHFTGKNNYESVSRAYGMQFTPSIIASDSTMDILACLWWLHENKFTEAETLMDAIKKFKSKRVLEGKAQQEYTDRVAKFLHSRRVDHDWRS